MLIVFCREKDITSLRGLGVVAMTVMVQFMHLILQKELSPILLGAFTEASPALLTFILACAQVTAAIAFFGASCLQITTSSTNREAVIISVLAYTGGLFLNNYVLWRDESAACAFYSVHEPVMCMLLLYMAACIPTDMHKAGAVVCLSVGAAILTAHFTPFLDSLALIHVLTSAFVTVRNMGIKHLYDCSVNFKPCKQEFILTMVACVVVTAILLGVCISQLLLVLFLLVVVSCALSVFLLHLQLMLLSLYDTLTVAVFMLWAQVLYYIIIMADIDSPSATCVIIGVGLFAAGHYAFFSDGLESGPVHLNVKEGQHGWFEITFSAETLFLKTRGSYNNLEAFFGDKTSCALSGSLFVIGIWLKVVHLWKVSVASNILEWKI